MKPPPRFWKMWVFCWVAATACDGCFSAPGLSATIPLITPSADSVDFGDVPVGTQRQRTVTLRSSGNGPLGIQSITINGPAVFTQQTSTQLPTTLAPGTSMTVDVTLAPTQPGPVTGELVVQSSADNGGTLRIALRGTALPPLDCDDQNPCTDDALNPLEGRCVYTPHLGDCSDGTACTENDFCVATTCVGIARPCVDPTACTRDLCDAATGCVFIPDASACDDNNACTAELCDAVNGCDHITLPNGTPCAPVLGCASQNICLDGACINQPAPDGTPCTDFDLCTGPDTCQTGTCVGVRIMQDPAVVSHLPTFGGPGSTPLVLDDSTILFATPRGFLQVYSVLSVAHTATGGVDLTLVKVENGRLKPVATLALEDVSVPHLIRVSATTAILAVRQAGGPQDTWAFHQLTLGSTSIAAQAVGSITTNLNGPRMAWLGNVLYVAQVTLGGQWLDFSAGPTAVTQGSWTWPTLVFDILADPVRNQLVLTGGPVRVANVVDPHQPQALAVQPLQLPAYDGALDGDFLVTRDACCTTQVTTITDLRDWSTVRSFNALNAIYGGLALANNTLLALVPSATPGDYDLRTVDLTTSDAPVGRVLLGRNLEPGLMRAVSGRGNLVATGAAGGSTRVLFLDGGGQLLTGPGHGGISWLQRVGNSTMAYSSGAVQRLDVMNNGTAVFGQGGSLPLGAGFVRLAPNVVHGVFPASRTGIGRSRSVLLPAAVVDAQQPDGMVAAGSVRFEGASEGSWFTLATTGAAALWTFPGEINPRVNMVDLAAANGAVDQLLPSTSAAVVDTGCAVAFFPQRDEDVLVYVTEGCNPEPAQTIHLLALHGSQPPTRVASSNATMAPPILDIAATSDRLVVLLGEQDGLNALRPYSGNRVMVLNVLQGASGATLTTSGLAYVPEVNGAPPALHQVLAFAGNTAFFTSRHGVVILDLQQQPPGLRGFIPTPEPVVDAVFVDGRVHLATTHAVTVVEPPCPPPVP